MSNADDDPFYCWDRSYFDDRTCKGPFQDSCCKFGVDTGFPGEDIECVFCSNDQCGTNNSCTDGLLYKYNVSECCNSVANYGELPCNSCMICLVFHVAVCAEQGNSSGPFHAESKRCYNTSEFVNGTCPTSHGFSGKCCIPPVGSQPEQCVDCSQGLCGTGEQITTCSLFGNMATYQCCVDLTGVPPIASPESAFG